MSRTRIPRRAPLIEALLLIFVLPLAFVYATPRDVLNQNINLYPGDMSGSSSSTLSTRGSYPPPKIKHDDGNSTSSSSNSTAPGYLNPNNTTDSTRQKQTATSPAFSKPVFGAMVGAAIAIVVFIIMMTLFKWLRRRSTQRRREIIEEAIRRDVSIMEVVRERDWASRMGY